MFVIRPGYVPDIVTKTDLSAKKEDKFSPVSVVEAEKYFPRNE
jgi:hypothetical protein